MNPSGIHRQIPLSFNSGEDRLGGVLTLPAGGGPHPAAVFIHGSGGVDKTARGMYSPIFHEFAARGVASLSWDKPGVGDSTGQHQDQSFGDRTAEGIAAIECLRSRDDIDSGRIGLWGISQAGWVMPSICKSRPDIAFVIGVSVPTSTVQDQDLFRIRHSLPASGFSDHETEEALHFVNEIHRLALADATFEEAVERLGGYAERRWAQVAYGGVPNAAGFAFLKRIILAEPKPDIESIRCPVLLALGEKDTLVDTAETAETYERLLAESGNGDLTIVRFPNADHIMTLTETGGQREVVAKINGAEWRYAPGYLKLMDDWLEQRMSG